MLVRLLRPRCAEAGEPAAQLALQRGNGLALRLQDAVDSEPAPLLVGADRLVELGARVSGGPVLEVVGAGVGEQGLNLEHLVPAVRPPRPDRAAQREDAVVEFGQIEVTHLPRSL
jgi:hypothetical protein